MELYYVLSIVDRKKAARLLELHGQLRLSVVLTALGKGTATSEQLSLYDLEPSDKAVVAAIATKSSVKQLLRAAKQKLFMDIPGNGVMLSVPIKGVSGGNTLAYFTDGQSVEGGKPDMNFENELIIVILNEGYSDNVMDAARRAGATGGTVLHAKGTGRNRAEKFHGVSLAEEKDMIYILAAAGKKGAIMQAIQKDCGTHTPAGAISFSLPVSQVCGVRRLDDE